MDDSRQYKINWTRMMKWFADKNIYKSYMDDLLLAGEQVDASALANKTVFITGSCGLIGSCLAEMLLTISKEKKVNIQILLGARRTEELGRRFPLWEGKYKPVRYDALDPTLPNEDLDFVFHCASNAHPRAYFERPVETSMTNVQGTFNLLKKLSDDDHGRMLYVSSSEVYGRRSSKDLYRESDNFSGNPLNQRSCYPLSKCMAENLCSCYATEYGVESVIVRPGHIYGPTQTDYDSRAHAQFVRAAALGNPVVMKSMGTQFRSYCYVVDCVSAMLYVALNGNNKEVYNISNPNSDCTIAELAATVARVANVELIREKPSANEIAGYSKMENSALNSEKLMKLGWKGCFSLESGIKRTIEFMRKTSCR